MHRSRIWRLATAAGLALAGIAGLAHAQLAHAQEGVQFPSRPGGGYAGGGSGSYQSSATISVTPGSGTYSTLQKAIDAIPAGGTVQVPAGAAFSESLYIAKPVRLVSASPGSKFTVNAKFDRPCALIAAPSAGRVIIEGARFVSPSSPPHQRPCVQMQSGSLRLVGSEIVGTLNNYAVSLEGGQARIEDSKISGGQIGVRLEYALTAEYILIGNTITGNVHGISVNGDDTLLAVDNDVTANLINGVVATGGGGRFVANRIGENGQTGVIVQRSGVRPIVFSANRIFENGQTGMWVWPGSTARVSGNYIYDNEDEDLDYDERATSIIIDQPNSFRKPR